MRLRPPPPGDVPDHLPHTTGGSDPILTRIVAEDKVPWYRKKNLRSLYLFLFPTCMGVEMTSGFDSSIINTVQLNDAWKLYFNNPTGALSGIISASYTIGAVLGLPFVPFINDRYGRRWSILFGSIIMIIGSIIQGLSNGVGMYITARMFLGFGIPFAIIAASSLMGELAYPKERPTMTSIFNASWYIGNLVAAVISFGTQTLSPSDWSWRIPSLLQGLPSLLQIAFVFFIPESPRFLISHDRHEEAYAILVKYHSEGEETDFSRAEMAQIRTTVALELESSKQSWWSMVDTPGMRRRILVCAFMGLFAQFSGNTLISFYLGKLLELLGFKDAGFKNKLNVGLASWQMVNAVIIALLVTRWPRRRMFLICTCSLLCVYIGWTISTERFLSVKSPAAAGLAIFFIFAYNPCYNIGLNALAYTYMVEIFPYSKRARGLTIYQFFVRGAVSFTTFMNPIGLDAIAWKWLVVYCCWLGFEIVFIYFIFPETHGRTLEELAFLFEDKDFAEKATMAVEKEIHTDVHDAREKTA